MRPPTQPPNANGSLVLPMRFLAVGLLTLALLSLTYPWHLDMLRGSFYAPHLLTFVHVNTLGLIGAVIFGASYQMLPIVLQTALAAPRAAQFSWWLYVAGLVLFVAGMEQGTAVVLGLGGSLTYAAVVLYIYTVGYTLRAAPFRDTTWWHVAVATAALGTGASLGLLLALSKYVGFLSGLTLPTLAAHATLMVGGWVTPLLTGVAYRLVSMFTLTEDRLRDDWAQGELCLTAGGAWMLAASLLLGVGQVVSLLGSVILLAGIGLFIIQIFRLYRLRLRRSPDIHIQFLVAAMAFGLLGAGLLAWGFLTGRGPTDPIWIAAGWLAIVGWAQTSILGFLHKIGPFLTWMHRYGPIAGVRPVPMLEDLYSRRLALLACAAWVVGVALAAMVPLASVSWAPVAAAISLMIGGAIVVLNALRVARHWFGWTAPVAGIS
ncbi:MAG: hypothetical protein AB7P40_12010 [Chloroflexota bacterium]